MNVKLICINYDPGCSRSTKFFKVANMRFTIISIDPDSIAVDEIVVCDGAITEIVFIVYEPLMAGHVSYGPVVLFQELNYLISVFN